MTVCTRRKNLLTKENSNSGFYLQQNSSAPPPPPPKKKLFPLVWKFVCTSPIKHIEKYFSTIRKKLLPFRKYLKKSKKLVSTLRNMVPLYFLLIFSSLKIRSPLAIKSSFFKICFSPIPTMVPKSIQIGSIETFCPLEHILARGIETF